jgi:hypothetical protein
VTILPENLDYTTKDFGSIRRRVFRLIRTIYPEWTNETVLSIGNLLVEAFAFVMDVTTFYQDQQAKESRWSTAQLRKNLLAMVKLIGYQASGATAATTTETFTLAQAMAADVTIEAGRQVRTPAVLDSVAFQLLEDLVIPAGTTVATATVEHSEFQEDIFESDGTAGQRFTLTQRPYLEGSATPAAANGAYTLVDDFLDSTGTDLHCTLTVDENDVATVVFGDGRNGRIPIGTISIPYKTGGGTAGRLDPAALTVLDGIVQDANGNIVRCTVTNVDETTGGADRQGVEQIRQLAPRSLRTLTRAVAREDFENGALGVSGVARALHLTKNEDDTIGENTGMLFIVPDDYGTASGALLTSVKARFFTIAGYADPDLPALSTFGLQVLSAVYQTVDFSVKLYKRKGKTATQVKAAVQAALDAYFTLYNADGSVNDLLNFGFYNQDVDGEPTGILARSDLLNLVRDATGVARIGDGDNDFLLNGERRDVTLIPRAFPKLGTVTLVDGDTGLVIP